MKYFLDTEFYENGTTIDLISIGVVCEDGREFYGVNAECNFSVVSDWVLDNVLMPMGLDRNGWDRCPTDDAMKARNNYTLMHTHSRHWLAVELLGFIKNIPIKYAEPYKTYHQAPVAVKPEFWGYYADYDWVVFCQLFGTMMDLPVGFPMYCHDIKQLCDGLGNPQLPTQGKNEHNALADAHWNKHAYEFLVGYKEHTNHYKPPFLVVA
jgi:hypothetical protein